MTVFSKRFCFLQFFRESICYNKSVERQRCRISWKFGIFSFLGKFFEVVGGIRYEIITGISKIEPLKKALGKFHITGMTVYQVLGCGVQHGTQEFEVEEKNKEISLLPKEVVMIVLPTEELDGLLEFVKKELYTGHIGDGKIFVSDVTNVIRVRTGEEGIDALLYGEK